MNPKASSKLFEQQYQRRFAIRLILRAVVQLVIILFITRGHSDLAGLSLAISLSLYLSAFLIRSYSKQISDFTLILGDIPALVASVHLPSHELGFEAFVPAWLIGVTVANLRNGVPTFLPLYILAAWAVVASHANATANPTSYLLVQGGIVAIAGIISFVIVLERGHNRIDELTKVFNRSAGLDELNQYMKKHSNHALAFIDLKGFKAINDQFGHTVGDEVLSVVAGRLSKSLKQNGLVLRYGGDEFIAASTHPDLHERLKAVFQEDLRVDKLELKVDARIGIMRSSQNMELQDVVKEADKRMYQERDAELALA